MRLREGICVKNEETFGVLNFSALRREVHEREDDGQLGEIKERTYDLKCKTQGQMIQVSIPASVPVKDFAYNEEVVLVNPTVGAVATASFQGAEVDWYVKADDIVPKGKPSMVGKPQQNQQGQQHEKKQGQGAA